MGFEQVKCNVQRLNDYASWHQTQQYTRTQIANPTAFQSKSLSGFSPCLSPCLSNHILLSKMDTTRKRKQNLVLSHNGKRWDLSKSSAMYRDWTIMRADIRRSSTLEPKLPILLLFKANLFLVFHHVSPLVWATTFYLVKWTQRGKENGT